MRVKESKNENVGKGFQALKAYLDGKYMFRIAVYLDEEEYLSRLGKKLCYLVVDKNNLRGYDELAYKVCDSIKTYFDILGNSIDSEEEQNRLDDLIKGYKESFIDYDGDLIFIQMDTMLYILDELGALQEGRVKNPYIKENLFKSNAGSKIIFDYLFGTYFSCIPEELKIISVLN